MTRGTRCDRRHRPRILLLGALPPPYIGPTLATQVLLDSRLKDEFDLIHLDTSDHRDAKTLGAIDFTNVCLGLKSYVLLLWRILCCRPQIVYVPISQTSVGYLRDSIYILIAKLFGRRVVCHLRGGNFRNWLDGASWIIRRYVPAVHRHVDAQIVLGECLRPLFNGIVSRERIFVVPNGKDVAIPKRQRAGGPVRVLFLANMMRTKGVLDALYAVPEVFRKVSNVEFVFAGAWNERDVRQEVFDFLDSHSDLPITWLGPVTGEDKYQLFADADVFVFPSYYAPEGHPWVIVEAMAAGLPIVSTDQGAIRESVIDGQNGFLVEKQNPSDIAAKLVCLLRDPHLRSSMGQHSREMYVRKLTEDQMVESVAQVFRKVLSPCLNGRKLGLAEPRPLQPKVSCCESVLASDVPAHRPQ